MSEPCDAYRAVAQPPAWALRPIAAGRLKGKTDINPQWRITAMTEQYGLCGVGWKFEVVRKWTEPGPDGQVFAFADILLYVKHEGEWSEPIPGHGGNKLVDKESKGLYANDEGFKMAVTDALSTAMRMIGVAADVYAGMWDGSKFKKTPERMVTMAQLTALKKPWDTQYGSQFKDRNGKAAAFAAWVHETLDLAPGTFNVQQSSEWEPEDYERCCEALGIEAARL